MKKFLTFALAATLGVASFANANNEKVSSLAEVKSSNNRVRVVLKEGLGKVRLALLDEEGKRLHQQTVFVKNDVLVPYNLTELPAGVYHLMIENSSKGSENDRVIYEIEREENPVSLPLTAYRKDLNENSVKVSVIGLDEPGVQVQFSDRLGKEIYSEVVEHPGAFSKVYTFKNMKAKDVNIHLVDAKGRTKDLFY